MPTYSLFNRSEYFQHLTSQYKQAQAGDRIILATMEFRPDQPAIKGLVNAMSKASKNGAHVTFIVDAYSFMLKEGSILGPLFFSRRMPKTGYGEFRTIVAAINTLHANGVNVIVVNKPTRPFKNPFGGRSHIKFAVYNQEVFIGGCNLSSPEQLDVMVRTKNKTLASKLNSFTAEVAIHKNVYKALGRSDIQLKIDNDTELLIDAGVRKQSLIYDQASKLINSAAKKVFMTCQYFPNSYTPAALAKAAKRGVGIHLAYNHPDQHAGPIRGIQKRTVAMKKRRLPTSVFENELAAHKNYLHAKILLSEKEVIIGSHNFVKMGVNLGTAEIALHSTSPTFIKSARQWVEAL